MQPNIFTCLQDNADEAPLVSIKIEHQRCPAKPLISGRSQTQYVAMVAKLVCSYFGDVKKAEKSSSCLTWSAGS